MGNKKISELNLLTTPQLSTVIPVVEGGETQKLPVGTLLQSGLPISASSIVASSLTVNGNINANQFLVTSTSISHYTASTKFGLDVEDTHEFTGSVFISGNLGVVGKTNLTGSFTVSGSTIQIGNNTLSGNTALTGSVTISGSTTQIGNTTLLGNTLLSGSLTISGSEPGAATNINIFGDTSLNGVLKFLPIVEQLDTEVSASYIFVSGSTKDLYFSQNGEGFNNITRLRWLEGNLYTGLLNGGVVEQIDTTNYRITSGSGIIVNLNASVGRNPYPTIQYLNWNTLSSSISPLSATYDQQFIGVDTNGQIVKQGDPFQDGQFASIINIGLVLHQNRSTINGVKTQPALGYGYSQRISVFTRAFGPLKLSGYSLAPSGSSTGSLVLSSGIAFLDGGNYLTSPTNPSEPSDSGMQVSKLWRYYNSSSYTENVYDTNGGAGYTTIDRTKYSKNGVLTAVTTGSWTTQRCFWYPSSVGKALVVYYGNLEYSSSNDAFNGLSNESFQEANNTKANAVYVGSLLLRNDADFTNEATFQFIPGGLFRSISTAAGTAAAGAAASVTLASLGDVALSNNQTNDVLTFNGSNWANKPITSFGFGTTSSFNALTASFNSFSSSVNSTTSSLNTFSSSVNSKTGSWVTTSSFNSFTSSVNSTTNSLNIFTSSINSITGSYVLTSSNAFYGSFFDTTIQSASANTAYSMRLNTTDKENGFSITSGSRITAANKGVYNLQFSAQLLNTANTNITFDIWLAYTGSNYAYSNTAQDVTKVPGSNGKGVAAWNFVVPIEKNDWIELKWSCNDSTGQLFATSSVTAPVRPAVPSVIATINQVAG
jgi:hypothetical protein